MEARLRDPAHRDQDGALWRRGRFAERLRRQWNMLDVAGLPREDLGPAGLDALAQAVQAKIGGDVAHLRARLEEFAELERDGGPPADDALVVAGAPV